MSKVACGPLGWLPDMPDWRDVTLEDGQVTEWLSKLPPVKSPPARVDWREFGPIVDDGDEVPSSTRACVDLVEHFERRALGSGQSLSKPFVFKGTTRLAQAQASHPLSLRSVWKAIVRFGAPPTCVWPGVDDSASAEPDTFVHAMAIDFSALRYVRLAARPQSGTSNLECLRSFLAAGFSFVAGIPTCSSLAPDGEVGFPTLSDIPRGGEAVLVVGYDDDYRLRSDRGCFLIRGYWNASWGNHGYGWLPYSYMREQLATDFWTILHPTWLESGEFSSPI
jgi:C1A family cysteine protease